MNVSRYCISMLLLLSTAASAADMRSGESVIIDLPVDDDLYAAGGEVDHLSSTRGDLVTAGGRLNLDGEVFEDVLAAGGDIVLRARVHDDVRIAGGNVTIHAQVRDDLVAAGGRLRLTDSSRIGGDCRIAGGEVFIDGRVFGALSVSAGLVVINGRVDRDVEIWADRIELGPDARIGGNLRSHGPGEPRIHETAVIDGEVSHHEVAMPAGRLVAGVMLALLFVYLVMVVTAVVMYLLFPGVAAAGAQITRQRFWPALGLGLATLAATPLLATILLSTGFGAVLGLLLLLLYLVLLLTGYLGGVYTVSEWLRGRFNSESDSRLVASLWIAAALLLLSLVGLVPVIGFLVGLLVLLSGMGSQLMLLWRGWQVKPQVTVSD